MATVLGCTNPAAANYDPSATLDDGSCIYLAKIGDNCYYFEEAPGIEDQSFTLSYSLESDAWVFYHDYIPNFYIGTRKQLYTSMGSQLWKHNSGAPGQYYPYGENQTVPYPFFIDIVFNYSEEVLLDSIQWFTETMNSLASVDEFTTFTHLTVWNSQQCTGKLPITDYIPYSLTGTRKTVDEFSFNELRDIVIDRSAQFVGDIFANFRPIDAQLDSGMPWYEKRFLQSNYFIVRLEYDNVAAKAISLHSADISGSPSVR
jgi:hypothetical protein